MSKNQFEILLLESAEGTDKKLKSGRIALLKKSYDFFKNTGLSDDDIKSTMALTSHEMHLIKKQDTTSPNQC